MTPGRAALFRRSAQTAFRDPLISGMPKGGFGFPGAEAPIRRRFEAEP
jgi:hypothetical protein